MTFKGRFYLKTVLGLLLFVAVVVGFFVAVDKAGEMLIRSRIGLHPDDYRALMWFARIFAGIGIVVGIFVRSMIMYNRDTELEDMGAIEIQRRIGAYEDELERRGSAEDLRNQKVQDRIDLIKKRKAMELQKRSNHK